MKKLTLLASILLVSGSIFAQSAKESLMKNVPKEVKLEDDKTNTDPSWKLSGTGGLNFSQTSLTNWSTGGDNSVAGTGYLNGALLHQNGNWLWVNTLALEYGINYTSTQKMQKTSDKIEIGTQLGYSTDKKWYYTAMADFRSQFYKGYNYPNKNEYISKFMAPGYLNVSLGIEYRPENSWYSIYFSPAASKITFVLDDFLSDKGSFGVDPGDKVKTEWGTFLKARAERYLMHNIKLITKADFFTAYNSSFGNIDVDWDLLISMKVNKYINASINTTLRYDDDVKYINKQGVQKGPRVQFKEVIGVGVNYSF